MLLQKNECPKGEAHSFVDEKCFGNGTELFWDCHLRREKEGKQIDGKFGVGEITDEAKLVELIS